MRLPAAAQSAGVPPTVSVKVSQLAPSTQLLSSAEEPPVAVPSQARGELVKSIVSDGGAAAKLSIASKAPTEQRPKAMKMRGLKMPDSAVNLFPNAG